MLPGRYRQFEISRLRRHWLEDDSIREYGDTLAPYFRLNSPVDNLSRKEASSVGTAVYNRGRTDQDRSLGNRIIRRQVILELLQVYR